MKYLWWLLVVVLVGFVMARPEGVSGHQDEPDFVGKYAAATLRGSPNARVTLVVFSDFECTFCKQLVPTLDRVSANYPDDVRLVFKHRPLPKHVDARLAHEAAVAAAAQHKFWPMHDLLFANQGRLAPGQLIRYAERLHLDADRLRSALNARVYRSIVDRDILEAEGLGVTSTPTVFINGRRLVGARPFSEFTAIIEEELGTAPLADTSGFAGGRALRAPQAALVVFGTW